MIKVTCLTPSTFFSYEPVKILDNEFKIFYLHPNVEKKINFNLPEGIFYTNNHLIKKTFQPYKKFDIKGLMFNPKDFKLIVEPNPNKATINTFHKTIKVDPEWINTIYKPCIVFLLAHELAHLKHGSNVIKNGKIIFDAEQACDNTARNYMLANGYNDSQINACVQYMLKHKDRRSCMQKNLNKDAEKFRR